MSLKDKIDLKRLPQHVAVIMDGNGRWAKNRGQLRVFGHQNGVRSVREVSEAAAELGVKYLTLYAFSTENWKRPALEVNALMALLASTALKEVDTLNKNNIRLAVIGDIEKLPAASREGIREAVHATRNNTRMTLVLALSYSSRNEITQAVRELAAKVKAGHLQPDDINEDLIAQHLYTRDMPEPELMIRTSGEHRISNFLLWQLSYAELYFTEVLWPDFRKENFYEAIYQFQNRERRFGMTGDQVKT